MVWQNWQMKNCWHIWHGEFRRFGLGLCNSSGPRGFFRLGPNLRLQFLEPKNGTLIPTSISEADTKMVDLEISTTWCLVRKSSMSHIRSPQKAWGNVLQRFGRGWPRRWIIYKPSLGSLSYNIILYQQIQLAKNTFPSSYFVVLGCFGQKNIKQTVIAVPVFKKKQRPPPIQSSQKTFHACWLLQDVA